MFLTYLAIGLLILTIAWWLITYNGLINSRNAVEQSWSNIEVELKRRADLIGNLVEIVKGYTKHEKSTLEDVTALRNRTYPSATEGNAANKEMNGALSKIMALAEAYPDIKANQQFLTLHSELVTTENRIAERRNAYNQTVSIYENARQTIPSNIVADAHGFTAKSFFDAPDELASAAPEIKLQ